MLADQMWMLATNGAPNMGQDAVGGGNAGNGAVELTPGSPGTANTTGGGGGGGAGFFDTQFMLILALALGAMIIFSLFTGRREKKKRAEMLASVRKGDRIQTVGGILGSVMEAREDEVIIKIDENTNTRMRVIRGAIQNVFRDGDSPGPSATDAGGDDKKAKADA